MAAAGALLKIGSKVAIPLATAAGGFLAGGILSVGSGTEQQQQQTTNTSNNYYITTNNTQNTSDNSSNYNIISNSPFASMDATRTISPVTTTTATPVTTTTATQGQTTETKDNTILYILIGGAALVGGYLLLSGGKK